MIGFPGSKRAGLLFALSLVFALTVAAALAGCAPRGDSARQESRDGFYAGVSGGLSRP